MSFILDALKKSEAERARQAGPALLEMHIARPRRRVAPWFVILVLLLAVNLAVLLWFVLRQEPVAPATTVARPADATPVVSAPASEAAGARTAAGPAPLAPGSAAALPPAGAFVADPGASVAAEGVAAAPDDNPADLEPALDPPPGSVRVASTARPNYSELGGGIPDLRLDLHVYAERAADRYALINMHKVREGEVVPEGARVVEITRDGVVLEWQGREFMLGRE